MKQKVLDTILTGLNYFFFVFAKFFEGVIWLSKKIGFGISYVFVKTKKGLGFVFSKIGKGISYVYYKVLYYFQQGIKYLKIGIEKLTEKLSKNKFFNNLITKWRELTKKISSRVRFHHRKAIWGVIFIMPLIVGFIYFFLLPFVTTIIYSFSNVYTPSQINDTGRVVGIVTEFVGFDNYKWIWNVHASFKSTLWTVFKSTLSNSALILIFSLIMAVVLNSEFRGRAFVRAIFFMPVIFNSQAVEAAIASGAAMTNAMEAENSSIFDAMFNFNDFLLNANLPVTAVNFLTTASASIFTIISYSGVQILLFLAGIQSVPKHLYEAAKIEGATQYEIFWKITFPMVSPLLLTAGVYTVVDSFMTSDLIKLMKTYATRGDVEYTLGLGSLTNDGIYAAMSILFLLIGIATIAIVVLLIKPMVFYYDE